MGRTRNNIVTARGRAILQSLLRRGQDNHKEQTILKAKDISEQNTDRAGQLITIFLPAVEFHAANPGRLLISAKCGITGSVLSHQHGKLMLRD